MAVYRVQRTRDYTVMSNYHLRDKNLTLKSKGLLSMILSLPDEWNYTTRGLAAICKEGVDAIGSALKELETAGYIVRRQLRGANGRITDTEYIIYERPHPREDSTPDTPAPGTDSPDTENPDMVPSDMDTPYLEMPAELNTKESNSQSALSAHRSVCLQAGSGVPPRCGDGCFGKAAPYRGRLCSGVCFSIPQLSSPGFIGGPALRRCFAAGCLCQRQERQEVPERCGVRFCPLGNGRGHQALCRSGV